MKSRFRTQLRTTTIALEGREPFQIRYLGHGAITRMVCAYPGLDILIEDLFDGLMKLPSVKSAMAASAQKKAIDKAEITASIMQDLQNSPLSIGHIAALIITKAPTLVFDLIIESAVLEQGDTRDDFADYLDSFDLMEIGQTMLEWYAFNFVGGVGPLFSQLAELFGKKKKAAPTTEGADTVSTDEQRIEAPALKTGFPQVGFRARA